LTSKRGRTLLLGLLVPLAAGAAAGVCFVLTSDRWFNGQARSLIVPQIGFLVLALAPIGVARHRGWLAGRWPWLAARVAVGFYATWLLLFVILALVVPPPHG
jgi:hypothetical protein